MDDGSQRLEEVVLPQATRKICFRAFFFPVFELHCLMSAHQWADAMNFLFFRWGLLLAMLSLGIVCLCAQVRPISPSAPSPRPPESGPPATPPASGSIERLDADNGFNGVVLGLATDKVTQLEKLFEFQGGTTYARKGDPKQVGELKVDSISYEFFQERLAAIHVWITPEDQPDPQSTIRVLERLYGPGTKLPRANMTGWMGKAVLLTLKSLDDGSQQLTFAHKEIHQKMEDSRRRGDYLPDPEGRP
jgi:hypothetical protein